jgi:hypothetical protein
MKPQHFADQQFTSRRERKHDLSSAFERKGRRGQARNPDID